MTTAIPVVSHRSDHIVRRASPSSVREATQGKVINPTLLAMKYGRFVNARPTTYSPSADG